MVNDVINCYRAQQMLGRVDDARADAERVMQLGQRLGSASMLAAGYYALALALGHDDPDADFLRARERDLPRHARRAGLRAARRRPCRA